MVDLCLKVYIVLPELRTKKAVCWVGSPNNKVKRMHYNVTWDILTPTRHSKTSFYNILFYSNPIGLWIKGWKRMRDLEARSQASSIQS